MLQLHKNIKECSLVPLYCPQFLKVGQLILQAKRGNRAQKNVVNNIVLLRKRSSHWFLDFYFGYIWSFGIIHVFEGWSISVAILCLNGLEIWANDLKYISLICVFPYWRFTRYWKVWNIINSNFWSLYKQQWFIFTRI